MSLCPYSGLFDLSGLHPLGPGFVMIDESVRLSNGASSVVDDGGHGVWADI